ncbi:TMV resistance protein N-like [Dorcoceras hygrometricum]|uniref:TMV resistance protein N-like n=1 Tax=Dorcoceras hygrometricum TaxID=472368 RepID=A0A2Z7A2B2_9LAMI|nr:TMV resistance protein N-like [Dorcoceras hygrometricum]
MEFRVVRTNQYNQDLGLIHSINGNHLESPNEGSSIDHQVTIHLHAQNITMFPTNETCTADVIMSVEIVEAEYDGDVMMSGVLLWLTSSNPLRQTMSC